MTIENQDHFTRDRSFGRGAFEAMVTLSYELRFKDHGGHTFSVSALRAISDQQAVDKARRVYRCGIGDHYEIWRGDILVHVEAERSKLTIPA